jgi:MFS family permease
MSVGALSAFIFGPFVGGGLAQFGLRVPLYVAAGLSCLAMLAALRYVVDPNELKKQQQKVAATGSNKRKKRDSQTVDPNFKPWKSLRVYIIAAQTMFTTLAFNGLSSLMALVLLEERLGVVLPTDTVEDQGKKVALWVMAFVPALGGTQVFVLMGLFPRAVKNIGLLPTGAIGSLFLGLGLILIPFYPHPAYVFITQVLLAIGNGLQTNVSNTYLSKFAPKGQAARVLSYGTMADTIGNILGPQLTQIYLVNSQLPFFIAASFGGCASLCCVVLIVMGNHEHDDHKAEDIQNDKLKDVLLESGGGAPEGAAVATATESKGVELTAEEEHFARLRAMDSSTPAEGELDLKKQPLVQLIHPACHRSLGAGPRGRGDPATTDQVKYTTATYQELSDGMYAQLKEKNHLYGMRSAIKTIRQRTVAAHLDWFDEKMPAFDDPDDDTNDQGFKETVALFLVNSGHHDWAVNIPGIDLDSMISSFQVPM